MNKLFVAKKPMFISSNQFLSQLKKKYNTKKMGFSGILDPFACGSLIVATNQYTKLFRFLKKTPKTYIATLFLGAYSKSLDIEKIEKIEHVNSFKKEKIISTLKSFLGKQTQLPPKYSAKKIDGKRAYLVDSEDLFLEKEIEIEVFDIELINYYHPFVSFKVSVSEGCYIRSLGFDIAKRLNTVGALSYLERISEGDFIYECEKLLNPINYLNIKQNEYQDIKDLILGRKLDINKFKIKQKGTYYIVYENFLAIIEIDKSIKYLVNKVKLC